MQSKLLFSSRALKLTVKFIYIHLPNNSCLSFSCVSHTISWFPDLFMSLRQRISFSGISPLPGATLREDPIQATAYAFRNFSHPSHWNVPTRRSVYGQYVILVLNHVGKNFLRDTTIISQEGSHMNPEHQRSRTAYPNYTRIYLKLSLSQPSNHLSPSFLKVLMPVNSLCLVTHQPAKKRSLIKSLHIFYTDDFMCFLPSGQPPSI